jgi:peptide deformylase
MEFNLGPHNTLKESSRSWDFAIDGNAVQLEYDMIEFMKANKGIGLAANQIGLNVRVFVIGNDTVPDLPKPFAVFNPEIIEASEELILDQEGCLSFPGIWLTIKRPAWVRVKYQDSKGEAHEAKFEGLMSKCFQHELDHLNGVCFVDKVSKLKLQLAIKKQRKLI